MKGKASCPYCGKVLDLQVPINKDRAAKPFPGAVSCCIGCVRVSVFGDDLELREITDADRERLRKQTGVDVEEAAKFLVKYLKQETGQ